MLFDDHFDKIGKIAHSLCLLMKGLFSPSRVEFKLFSCPIQDISREKRSAGWGGVGAEGGWAGRAVAAGRFTPAGDSCWGSFCPRFVLPCLRSWPRSPRLPSIRRGASECRLPRRFTRGKLVGTFPRLLGPFYHSYNLHFPFSPHPHCTLRIINRTRKPKHREKRKTKNKVPNSPRCHA